MGLTLWLAAVSGAWGITCDQVVGMVIADVPEAQILDRLVDALDGGRVPAGDEACFAQIGLPAPLPAGRSEPRVRAYLVELHGRFPCHEGLIGAIRAAGFPVAQCVKLPSADTEDQHWTREVRAALRARRSAGTRQAPGR